MSASVSDAPLAADLAALVEDARAAARRAYAPYSGFNVGAAVRADDGRTFAAANVENASYGLTLCAEANAVAAAAVAGARHLVAIAVVGHPAGATASTTLATPCGRCRQMIREFAAEGVRIVVADQAATASLVLTMEELLPHAFGPDRLPGR